MGCGASKQGCYGENRPKELGKCAACSSEVRWSWLRTKTLFSYSELRTLLKVFQNAATTTSSQQPGGGSDKLGSPNIKKTEARAISSRPPLSTSRQARAPSSSVALGDASKLARMNKAQFMAVCDTDDIFRLSEVVGTFGSRLFDVFDEDGDGRLTFEDFALGLSKLLKVCGGSNQALYCQKGCGLWLFCFDVSVIDVPKCFAVYTRSVCVRVFDSLFWCPLSWPSA